MEQIAISPFGEVAFRHFFLADIITSIGSILKQFALIYIFFRGENKGWKTGQPEEPKHYQEALLFIGFIGFIPGWFRFA